MTQIPNSPPTPVLRQRLRHCTAGLRRAGKTIFIIIASSLFLAGLAAAVFLLPTSLESQENEANLSAIDRYFFPLGSPDYRTYTHTDYGFSIDLPNDFIVSNFEEDGREIILAEHPRFRLGFQMVISPLKESEPPLTKEKIQESDPSILIEKPVEFIITDGAPALRFKSYDPSLGETRELWFARQGQFYQLRMYSEDESWLDIWIRQLASGLFSGVAI